MFGFLVDRLELHQLQDRPRRFLPISSDPTSTSEALGPWKQLALRLVLLEYAAVVMKVYVSFFVADDFG